MVRILDDKRRNLIKMVNPWIIGTSKELKAVISKAAPKEVFDALAELKWRYVVQ